MNRFEDKIGEIEERIGYTFKDKVLLQLAFTHSSILNENKSLSEHNERLEFLGDSILGLIIADYLYLKLKSAKEGKLSHLKASLVDAKACCKYMRKLKLEQYILLGKGESGGTKKGRETIDADAFEALIGAIYLDSDFLTTKGFFLKNFEKDMEEMVQAPSSNYKAELQDYFQKREQKVPVYRIVEERGPAHKKDFLVAVFIDDSELGRGIGSSKKEAEQMAALEALGKIRA